MSIVINNPPKSSGSAFAAPTIRGTGIQASSAGSFTVNWPAGTAAGDLAVIFIGGGFGPTLPITGWSVLDSTAGSTNWVGATIYRVLSTADITTGHLVISMGGTFDAVLAIITFVGPTAGLRAFPHSAAAGANLYDMSFNYTSSQNATTAATRTLVSPDGYPATTDLTLYFGSNRTAGAVTVSRGIKQQQMNDGSAASGALYTEVVAAMGGVSPVFSYASSGGANTGDYQIVCMVKGSI